MQKGSDVIKVTVNTGIKSFILIDRITQAGTQNIGGIKTFTNDPLYICLESLAQLGAFHVRYLIGFERHAFLLKITRCLRRPMRDWLSLGFKKEGFPNDTGASAYDQQLRSAPCPKRFRGETAVSPFTP